MDAQLAFVQMLQRLLKIDYYEVAEVGQISGHKTYAVRPIQRGVDGRAEDLGFIHRAEAVVGLS